MKLHDVKIFGGLIFLLGGVGFYWWWDSPPTVEYDNLKYIQLMSTAVSSQNKEWLDRVELAVRKRHEAAEMSDRELKQFLSVIKTAAAGDWKTADRQCFSFAEAQLSRRRSKKATTAHHDHVHEGRS